MWSLDCGLLLLSLKDRILSLLKRDSSGASFGHVRQVFICPFKGEASHSSSLPEILERQHSARTEDSGVFRFSNTSGITKSISAHGAGGTIVAINSLNSVGACSVIH